LRQIISTGDADTDFFVLNEENLSSIVAKIPKDAKVSIVSVVGAFRTGKSFLLNFFLRYLRMPTEQDDLSEWWMFAEGDCLTEGNMNDGQSAVGSHSQESPSTIGSSDGWNLVDGEEANAVESALKTKNSSFQWRGGKERQTTGIWMWSEPFIRMAANGKDKLAVLLMDTQVCWQFSCCTI
jgi:atlastin